MAFQHNSWRRTVTGAVVAGTFAVLISYSWTRRSDMCETSIDPLIPKFNTSGQNPVCASLAAALPDSVYSQHHPAFQNSVNSYWSSNARELEPACVIKPADIHEVSKTIKVLKSEYDASDRSIVPVKFAVRSGGHSPEAGFASVNGGVVVDLSLLQDIVVSHDKRSVSIGVGARWLDVYSALDTRGLAIVGGRNSNVSISRRKTGTVGYKEALGCRQYDDAGATLAEVGVGGLILGGGISFFSPRFGMVCDNLEKYEIVIANGSILEASASQHEDLWRALKGGTGNFGIVTRVTAKTFASGDIWSGYAFWTSWQARKVLKAFTKFNKAENFDQYAAGPILALGYIQKLGLQVTACSLAYTKPQAWAPVFKDFRAIWRLWDSTKARSLSDATRELDRMSPHGLRQFQVTTTVLNDLDTFNAFKDIYTKKLSEVKNVKGSTWSLVLQPLSAAVTRKGSPNVLGLETRQADDTLIIVLVSVSWQDANDDDLVHRVSREIISTGEVYAKSKGTADPFRYLNYAASGQDPFSGYGATNKIHLQKTSKRYDPDGLFQRAKQGGFKLNLY